MFSLIWFVLLFSVSDASESTSLECDQQNNMTETNVTAAFKVCVVLKCSSEANTVESITWYECDSPKCEKLQFNSTLKETQPDIKSQGSMMDAFLKRRCSSSSSDLTAQYKDLKKNVCPFFSSSNVTFTVFKRKPVMILNLTEGKQANLTCTVPTFCFGSEPRFTWMWRRAGHMDTEIPKNTSEFAVESVTDVAQTHTSTLTFNVLARHHNTNITCRVTFAGDTATEETSYLKVISSGSSFVTRILENVLKDPIPFLIIFGTGVLIGMLLFSIIACSVVKCPRKKSRNMHESLEMVTTESFSKRDEDGIQDIQEDRTQDPEAAEGGAESNEPTKETVYADVNDTDVAPKETVYSNIDFSAMKERNPEDGRKMQETTETEYAEIKKGETKKRQDDDGEEGEMLKGSDEEEEIKEEDEEVKQGLLAEEVVGEGVPLYSGVDKMLDEN